MPKPLSDSRKKDLIGEHLFGDSDCSFCFSLIRRGYALGKRLLRQQLDSAGVAVTHFEEVQEETGNEAIYLLDADPLAVKAITVEIEDHASVGRLFDMDVRATRS